MHKNDMIDAAAKQAGITEQQGRAVVNKFLDALIDEIAQSGRMDIRGLGVFSSTVKPPRQILPRLKKDAVPVQSKPFVFVTFKAADNVKERILEKHVCKTQSSLIGFMPN